jgi:hypothetical protein
LVVAGAVAACSSSSSGGAAGDASADAAADTGKTTGDAGKDGSADATSDSTSDAKGDAASAGPTARFAYTAGTVPNLLDVPFPSDVYLANGKVIDPLPGAAAVITGGTQFITHELGKMNGFSRIAEASFPIDDPSASDGVATLDPTTIPSNEAACVADTSSVFVLDLSATGATARVACRAAYHDDRAFGTKGYKPVLAVGPGRGVVLAEGHQYATVITSRLKTTGGNPVGATAAFKGVAASGAPTSVYSTALATANTLLASALATDHATIVDIAPFTTNSETKVLLDMRTNLESVTPPALAWDQPSMGAMGAVKFAAKVGGALPTGFTASLDDLFGTVTAAPLADGSDDPNADLKVRAHNKIAAIGTAVFQAENYLSPANGYSALDAATFTFDASGKVIPDPTHPKAPIWVTFFIPTAAMPANGYPVVIVQHGLGESRAIEAFNLANTFANAGWMVAAIDSVTFGARASEASYQVDKVNNFAAGGGAYSGPDGLADAIGSPPATNGLNDLFGELLDIGAIRDQFRQAEIDTSQLARVLASSTLDLSPLTTGATAPKVDATKIAYFGNSLGAIQGAAAAAIEPLIQTWVLNVGGGAVMTELATHSPSVAAELSFAGLNFGATGDHLNESHPLMNFLQAIVDPADAVDFAPYVVKSPATVAGAALKPKNVLQIEVVYDEYVPNESNEALARSLGLGFATPNVGTNAGVDTLAKLKDPTTIPDRLPLVAADPDSSGLIHDAPITGTTAVLVQTMPARHGDNFQAGAVTHTFAIPYSQFSTMTPFVSLGSGPAASDPPFQVTCSYVAQQKMAVRFLADAFAGNVPNVTGFVPAVRDFDGDGTPDSTDPDSNNPSVK